MERWRLFVALAAALAALPLLAIDNVSSAEGRPESAKVAVLGASVDRSDPALDLLAARTSSWAAAREVVRAQSLQAALVGGEQSGTSSAIPFEALSLSSAADQVEAARAADAQRGVDAERNAAAAKKAAADAAAKQAAADAARRAASTTQRPVIKVTPTAPPAPPVASGEPTAAQWQKLRQCESGNNYAALSAGGRFRGAYQFSQSTWNWVAGQVAPQLVDVDPAEAAAGDQDNMAVNLFHMRGAGQWPVCGAHLR